MPPRSQSYQSSRIGGISPPQLPIWRVVPRGAALGTSQQLKSLTCKMTVQKPQAGLHLLLSQCIIYLN